MDRWAKSPIDLLKEDLPDDNRWVDDKATLLELFGQPSQSPRSRLSHETET